MFMLRCAELGLTASDLDDMTIGMVTDMLIEKSNDSEKYPYKATQEDINDFFGERGDSAWQKGASRELRLKLTAMLPG